MSLMSTEFAQQLRQSVESLRGAQQQQNVQMQSSLEELKSLMLTNREVRAGSKKAKTGELEGNDL